MAIPANQVAVGRFVDRVVPAYARSLNRLNGDFSAAAAFLLSGELFERIGCTGRAFVATAKAAYGGKGAPSPVQARRLALELLSEADRILNELGAATGEYRAAIEERHRTAELLTRAAEEVYRRAEGVLEKRLHEVLEDAPDALPDDPEELATKLGAVAGETFDCLRDSWTTIYEQLQNLTLPPAPFALSARQMYIETVKLFNHYRLSAGVRDRSRQARGLFTIRRRGELVEGDRRQSKGVIPGDLRAGPAHLADPMEAEAVLEVAQRLLPDRQVSRSSAGHRGSEGQRSRGKEAQTFEPPEELVKIVEGVGDVIGASLAQWQRSALERAYRQGPQNAKAAMDEATLKDELSQITRATEQLSALKTELARGLSPRYYLINLLRRA